MSIFNAPATLTSEAEFVMSGTFGECLRAYQKWDENTRRLGGILVDGPIAPGGGRLHWNVNFQDAEQLVDLAGF